MGRRLKILAGMPPLREWWRAQDRLAKLAAREAARAEAERDAALLEGRKKRRPKCRCAAYPWPHRPGGGLCRWPDPPLATFAGQAGKNAPVGMRRRSAIRRRLIVKYGWHPIRDRERIRRWLPKVYVAHCRRHGLPYPEWWMGGYVPAMRVTAEGPKASVAPAEHRVRVDWRTPEQVAREARWRDNRGTPWLLRERRRRGGGDAGAAGGSRP